MSEEKRLDGKTEVKLADAVLTRTEEPDLRGHSDPVVEKRVAFGADHRSLLHKGHKADDEKEHEKEKGHDKDKECEKDCGHDKDRDHEKDCKPCEEWHCHDVLCEVEFPCGCDPVKSGLTDVVDSIAHQEFGLAKILESESKKICKAIGIARCVDDLVKVDKSVQDTIKQINHVQIVLLDKLQEVSDICEGCGDCDCK